MTLQDYMYVKLNRQKVSVFYCYAIVRLFRRPNRNDFSCIRE